MAITYRKIGYDEIEKFQHLIAAFCVETNADDDAFGIIMERLSEGKITAFAAENGRVCGIVGYITAGTVAVPDFFFVLPDERNGVIGGMLAKVAIEYGKNNGIKKIIPMVTSDKEGLYTKIGFRRSKFILLEKEI